MAKIDKANVVVGEQVNSAEDKLELAIKLQQQWRFEEARAKYEALLQEDPEDANAHHNLGVLFSVQLLQPLEALPHFEAALNINPTKLQFWFSYLDALIKAGAVDVAEHVLALARNYGLNDLQISSFERDIRLARTTVANLVADVLSEADPLPEPQENNSPPVLVGKDPSMNELQQVLSLFNQKKYERAVSSSRKLIQRFPASVPVLKLLAEAEKRTGDFVNALETYRKLAELQPNDASAQVELADALLSVEEQEEALAVLESVLHIHPDYAPAHGKIGQIYQKQGNLSQALYSYARALRQEPYNPIILEKFGSILRTKGNHDGALVCFKYAVEASPNSAELQNVYGMTLRNQELFAAAENAFRSALRINPGYTPALRNLCHLLEFHGRFVEAESGFLLCARIEEDSPEALFEVGRNLVHQKRGRDAQEWLRRAINIKPNYVEAHIMLSAALSDSEEPSLALEEVKASIELLPHIPHLHTNLGVLNLALSRADDAIACFRRALKIDPKFSHARSCLLFALSHSSKISPSELYREHRAYGKLVEKEVFGKEYTSYSNTRIVNRPLKVGFVSADFRNHAVAQFVIPFFESLAKDSKVISYAYYNHGAVDDFTRTIQKNINFWRSVIHWTDAKLAEKIREDQIDILIDMSGHTGGNRLEVFARHPAPVQVTWLGYPGTTGLKAMDYRFMSRDSLAFGEDGSVKLQDQFIEKLVILPSGRIFKDVDEEIDVGCAPCLSNKYITFGSFNRLSKVDRQVICGWSQVLKHLPTSRLLMGAMPENGAPQELYQWFEENEIDLDRIEFYPRTRFEDYLRLHAQVDLCLDTFPYSGGTTTNHALQMGVPTLSIAGATLSSRASSNILHRAGLGDVCVGRGVDDMIRHALFWNNNYELLNEVRQKLRKNLTSNNEVLREITVRSVVRGFELMWENWCRGDKPKNLSVDYKDIGMEGPGKNLLNL